MKLRKNAKVALLAAAGAMALLGLAACTIILTEDVGGTSSGSGGVLDPMLDIFEEELNAAYSASRSLGASRGLAGGANSILHGLPATTVAKVRAKVRASIEASGLEKSRDLAKVAPAIASATAAALKDPAVVGVTPLADDELIQVNAVATRGVAKSLNAQGVAALAEGLGTEAERRGRLEALTTAASANSVTLGISTANLGDALQKVLLMVVDAGNPDVDAAGTGAAAPETLLAERSAALVRIAAAALDGKLTGADCSTALNDLANAAVVGLGNTAIASAGVDATGAKLQAVVQDGVLAGLFLAYYQFKQDAVLGASALRDAISFADAMTVAGTGAFADKVSANVQAVRATIVPAADTKARKAAIVSSPTGISGNVTANATAAASVTSGATTTWTSGSDIHVASSITINGNLVIEEGVTVYVAINANITVGATGSITAAGTLSSPVVFTRASSSAWGSIIVNSGGNSFAYCDISGGVDGIKLNGRATISNCLFHGNASNGLDAQSAAYDIAETTMVRDCYTYGNGESAVTINQYVDFDDSNHFYDPQTAEIPDPAAAFNRVNFYGDISTDVAFTVTEVPYYIQAIMYIEVAPGRLAISPGVVVKFALGAGIRAYGQILADGTAIAPIVFTSVNDSAVGGNTSGVAGSVASAGDWGGIDIMAAASSFSHCYFGYGSEMIIFNSYYDRQGYATIDACRFHHASNNGINGWRAKVGTLVTNCHFWSNVSSPLVMNENMAIDAANHFFDPASATAPDPAAAFNRIHFYGDISTPVVFAVPEVPYYIPGMLYVNVAPGRLSVSPGVVVKFAVGAGIRASGQVLAVGTTIAPIVFTSVNDSAVGGNTSGVAGSVASAGDWGSIDVMAAASTFSHCYFGYGVDELIFNSYYDRQGYATIDACRFHHASNTGIHAWRAKAGTIVTNCHFWSNGTSPVVMNENTGIDATNHFFDPASAAVPDPSAYFNRIHFYGEISKPVAFAVSEVPYYIPGTLIVNASPGKLDIAPGAVLKFANSAGLRVFMGGLLVAAGLPAAPITFTSLTDNTIGGITGGVVGSLGTKGDWGSVDLMSKTNRLEYCVFSFGGTPLLFNSYNDSEGYATVDHCGFSHNASGGIWATRADDGTVITNNVFTDNNANGTSIWDLNVNGNVNVDQSGNVVADPSYIRD